MKCLFQITLFGIMLLITGCQKDYPELAFVTVEMDRATSEGLLTYRLTGAVRSNAENASLEDHGFLWSEERDRLEWGAPGVTPIQKGERDIPAGNTNFEEKWNLPSLNTVYYIRAYIRFEGRYLYSEEILPVSVSVATQLFVNPDIKVERNTAIISAFILAIAPEGDSVELEQYGLELTSSGWDSTLIFPSRKIRDLFIFQDTLERLHFKTQYQVVAFAEVKNAGTGRIESPSATFNTKGGWVSKRDVPALLQDPQAIVINGKGYVLGNDRQLWEFDPDNNGPWTPKEILEVPVSGSCFAIRFAFTIGNKGYFGVELSDTSPFHYLAVYAYDPDATEPWKFLPMETPLPDLRRDAVAFSIGGKGYWGLGYVIDPGGGPIVGGYLDDFWVFTPPESESSFAKWDRLIPDGRDSIQARDGAVALVIGDKAFIGLGKNWAGYFEDFWEFDPGNGTVKWKKLDSVFPGNLREGASAFTIDETGFLGSGRRSAGSLISDWWRFDPGQMVFEPIEAISGPERIKAISFTINGKGYAGLGYDKNFALLTDFWEYIP